MATYRKKRRDSKKDSKELAEFGQKLSYEYGEKAADEQHERSKDLTTIMHELGSPVEKRRQLEEAGMSKSALMGGMLGGGASASMGASGGGGSLTMPYDAPSSREMADQQKQRNIQEMSLLGSQKELNEANTEKIKAQTETEGADKGLKEMHTESLQQGIENQKAQESLTKAETNLKNISAWEAIETYDARKSMLETESKKALEEFKQAQTETKFTEETYNEKVSIMQTDMLKGYIGIETAEQGIKLGEKQIDKIVNDMKNDNQQLQIKWYELSDQQRNTEIKKIAEQDRIANPSIWGVVGGIVERGINQTNDWIFRAEEGTTKYQGNPMRTK